MHNNEEWRNSFIMKVLVIVDMQNDFIDGALGTPEAQAIVSKVIEKIKNYPDKEETLLLYTKDTHYKNYMDTLEGEKLPVPHCIENTIGWCINKQIASTGDNEDFLMLRVFSSNKIINSRIYKNTFGSEDLYELLKTYKNDIEQVEFVGVCTSICVLSNAIMARMALPDTKIIVDASCCACVTPVTHNAALMSMKQCQIDVIGDEK